MKYTITFLVVLFLNSCVKDYNSSYTATFINKTGHQISILFYKGGIVSQTDTIKLSSQQQFQFANGSQRGTINSPGFSSKYFGSGDDSIIVVFDNLYKVSHYGNTPLLKARKYYLFDSLRNILNPKSYRFVSTPNSKNSYQNDHYYEFIEQDYLDAK